MGGNEDGGGFVAEEGGREGREEGEVEYCAVFIDQNSCGGPKLRIANTEVGGGLKTTMYALVCGAGFE